MGLPRSLVMTQSQIDEIYDYYCREMGQEPSQGPARNAVMILVKGILQQNPHIKTPFQFLVFMCDHSRDWTDPNSFIEEGIENPPATPTNEELLKLVQHSESPDSHFED